MRGKACNSIAEFNKNPLQAMHSLGLKNSTVEALLQQKYQQLFV